VLCPPCGVGPSGARNLSKEALKYLRHFQRSDYVGVQRARPAPEVQGEVEALLQHYVTYLLERALNSPEFIRQIKR
jgi:DNA repair protein RecO (recombination protein O)